MVKQIIKLIFSLSFILLLSGCANNSGIDSINYNKDVKPLIETSEVSKVRGSCNLIEAQSTCLDFIGEVFTEERMRLSCSQGKFSFDACPYSDRGGCQATPGTISESIAWSYGSGGAPISVEEAGYQAKACNALTAAKWVMPEDLLTK